MLAHYSVGEVVARVSLCLVSKGVMGSRGKLGEGDALHTAWSSHMHNAKVACDAMGNKT